MYLSKYNRLTKLDNSTTHQYVIFNQLSGSVDFLDEDEFSQVQTLVDSKIRQFDLAQMSQKLDIDIDLAANLFERGYLYNSDTDEQKLFDEKYREFQSINAETQPQIFLISTYGCNLNCSYCYQQGVDKPGLISEDILETIYHYLDQEFSEVKVKPYITLFGGEPLINTPAHRKVVEKVIDLNEKYGYQLAAVTNGYHLEEYIELLKTAQIKEIQVTLDGPEEIHNQRRRTKAGKNTFEKIINGIKKALESQIPINLRVVVDKENLNELVQLAELLESQGWLDLPPELFKTQIGRNYELIDCNHDKDILLSRVGLWTEIVNLMEQYPVLKKFHKPQFYGIKYLVENGEMAFPTFDTCPACKSELVFDLYGDVYGCTASCGREKYKLGTVYPKIDIDEEKISQWTSRDITSIPECKDCSDALACGGGCGVVAAEKNGNIKSADCRPIIELWNLGVNFYQEELDNLA